jgi:hypothetical protein
MHESNSADMRHPEKMIAKVHDFMIGSTIMNRTFTATGIAKY